MFSLILVWVLSALALYLTAVVVPGFKIHSFGAAMIAAVVVGLLNMFLKPILFILTLPVTILTLGLFTFVLTAVILRLTASMLKGFEITGWMPAILAAVVLALVQIIIHSIIGNPPRA